ncbi:MAG: hypothetical protein ABSA83_07140 [Verrucomicrobiota bacterium]|jgi:hypothetical protein
MNKIILPVSRIRAAAPQRQPGYLEECLRLGKISGELVEFTAEQFADIRRRFGRSDKSDTSVLSDKQRLGDAVHRIAGPIGRAIHWPCMKGDGTTDLKPGSPCDRVRITLNKL